MKRSNTILKKLRNSYITTTISISLVLFLLGLTGLILLNSKNLSNYVKEHISFDVVLKENVKESDRNILQKYLDAADYVKSTKYITKEEATENLKKELGEDFVDFLGYSPLLPMIEVNFYADYANNDSIAVIEKELSSFQQIHEIWYNKSLIQQINDNIETITLLILGFSLILFIISFSLINNTIRLSIYSKRFIINTMKLVGASNSFIRWPFLMKGVIYGVIGALIAIGMLTGIIYLAQKELKDIISITQIDIIIILYLIVVILGIIISWIATFFAVNHYLRMKTSDLYY
ncbi:MAG: permease-like cell division protein FtsX [Marinilabiliales bacterium]